MLKTDVAIVTWHQTYLSSYAGGYVRLREFLKRLPSKMDVLLLDNASTIYSDIVPSQKIIQYRSPKWINNLQKKYFILWFFLETISSTIILFNICSKLAKVGTKVFYFPMGEFTQLYLVSLLLKKRYPQVKVVIDVLNYGILDKSYKTYFLSLKKKGLGFIRAFVTTATIFFSVFLMKHTISSADYVFTVSEDFVKKIKKDYKKNTIDYTPSGVNVPKSLPSSKKEYLGIYIGRHTVEKGIFDVLAMWSEVVGEKSDALLVLAGHADATIHEAIQQEVDKRGLKKNVIVCGDISEKKKTELLSKSEVFIHLAHQEPLFPVITILEAFSYGLPAVFYDMNVFQSAKKTFSLSGKSMYVIENGNIQKAAEAILSYSHLSAVAKKEKTIEAVDIARKFSWDTIAKKEFAVVQSLINS